MGGKTGTTNDNADAWFMGYVPQLLAGAWVGFDDRFIRNEGDGARMARPIWEYFFKKVYADKTLGIDRDARFAKPADLENEIFSADPSEIISNIPPPGAEGEDVGVGKEKDYDLNNEYIGPESKPVKDDENKPKPDTSSKNQLKKEDENKIFEKVEIEASFKGGESAWRKYLERNLNPSAPVDNGAPEGLYTVYVQFVVSKDGSISDVRALTKHGYGMEEEAVRVIKKGPAWTPAIQNGRSVNAYRKQPITFQVQSE